MRLLGGPDRLHSIRDLRSFIAQHLTHVSKAHSAESNAAVATKARTDVQESKEFIIYNKRHCPRLCPFPATYAACTNAFSRVLVQPTVTADFDDGPAV